MPKKIFIWEAHPAPASFSAALADAYAAGASSQGAEIRRMALSDMTFEPRFEGYHHPAPDLEPDLLQWQDAIAWADHLFVVHPYWWGAMPATAKAVLDRALISGFGFKYHKGGLGWDKLLTGKTADVIITSDTPPLIDTLVYGRPGRRVIRNQVLKFCGITPRHVLQFGPIKTSTAERRSRWLSRAETLGRHAA
ncbi:NAD(P)H-dependent oxidoreductase [Roseovarius aestuariivivens]|uniref:NAD(P)H-dependent oxidoreductase n=1 Tax=Roseovarius aestuariivivens TaxID=1888910 RepID=UPI0010809B78|nr:NAD(P)H-dependent oxidoreductase [Roseovarius aestuariivivens]